MLNRPTPRVDRWKRDLSRALSDRGARTELATWLQQKYGSTIERWKVQIAKILNGPQIPDGEFVLAVEAWRTVAAVYDRRSLQQRKKSDG